MCQLSHNTQLIHYCYQKILLFYKNYSFIQSLNGKIDIRYVPALDQLHQTLSPKLTPLSPNSKLEKKNVNSKPYQILPNDFQTAGPFPLRTTPASAFAAEKKINVFLPKFGVDQLRQAPSSKRRPKQASTTPKIGAKSGRTPRSGGRSRARSNQELSKVLFRGSQPAEAGTTSIRFHHEAHGDVIERHLQFRSIPSNGESRNGAP